ncbi:uncharacterized protein LOC34622622 [Cyclospora cayetanensis]|uniref:Uncharacterized protein LOC34622622 n=1 Tax=Cyclospora cayetanensis TaxID=88456 RepID=A0A6P6RQ49_9EIME|nr:uncharacterized protein LOC34622622 [Cyclospora cayetanensis]
MEFPVLIPDDFAAAQLPQLAELLRMQVQDVSPALLQHMWEILAGGVAPHKETTIDSTAVESLRDFVEAIVEPLHTQESFCSARPLMERFVDAFVTRACSSSSCNASAMSDDGNRAGEPQSFLLSQNRRETVAFSQPTFLGDADAAERSFGGEKPVAASARSTGGAKSASGGDGSSSSSCSRSGVGSSHAERHSEKQRQAPPQRQRPQMQQPKKGIYPQQQEKKQLLPSNPSTQTHRPQEMPVQYPAHAPQNSVPPLNHHLQKTQKQQQQKQQQKQEKQLLLPQKGRTQDSMPPSAEELLEDVGWAEAPPPRKRVPRKQQQVLQRFGVAVVSAAPSSCTSSSSSSRSQTEHAGRQKAGKLEASLPAAKAATAHCLCLGVDHGVYGVCLSCGLIRCHYDISSSGESVQHAPRCLFCGNDIVPSRGLTALSAAVNKQLIESRSELALLQEEVQQQQAHQQKLQTQQPTEAIQERLRRLQQQIAADEAHLKALRLHRRLVVCDSQSQQQTKILDLSSCWFDASAGARAESSRADVWLSPARREERAALLQRLTNAFNAEKGRAKLTFDFEGRRVVAESSTLPEEAEALLRAFDEQCQEENMQAQQQQDARQSLAKEERDLAERSPKRSPRSTPATRVRQRMQEQRWPKLEAGMQQQQEASATAWPSLDADRQPQPQREGMDDTPLVRLTPVEQLQEAWNAMVERETAAADEEQSQLAAGEDSSLQLLADTSLRGFARLLLKDVYAIARPQKRASKSAAAATRPGGKTAVVGVRAVSSSSEAEKAAKTPPIAKDGNRKAGAQEAAGAASPNAADAAASSADVEEEGALRGRWRAELSVQQQTLLQRLREAQQQREGCESADAPAVWGMQHLEKPQQWSAYKGGNLGDRVFRVGGPRSEGSAFGVAWGPPLEDDEAAADAETAEEHLWISLSTAADGFGVEQQAAEDAEDAGVCLTVSQPHASLIVSGFVTKEVRSWLSAYRGRLWIHAAEAAPSGAAVSAAEAQCEREALQAVSAVSSTKEGSESEAFLFCFERPQLLRVPLKVRGGERFWCLPKSLLGTLQASLLPPRWPAFLNPC